MTKKFSVFIVRLTMLVVLLTGMLGQPQFAVSAASSNVTTITIPSTPVGGAAAGYTVGEVVTIRVTFSLAETVTGTPSIAINVGGNLRVAKYVSGSGTVNLNFAYTVVAGDVDANGISIAANSLARNGGSINNGTDAAQITHAAVTDQAADFIAGAVAALDTTAPVLRSALGAGSSITLFYDEVGSGLRAAPLPPIATFTFSRNGGVGTQLVVSSVSINHTANTVTLGLNGLINTTDTNMRVSYTANGTNDIQDVAGNKVANFSNVFVSNTMPSFDVKGNAMSFNNPSSITGDGRTAGNRVLFSNIITIDGQSIDAIVTTTALSGATISGFDTLSGSTTPALTGTPVDVDALWFKLNTTIGAGGGDVTITFNFIKGGSYNASNLTASKGDDVILQNVAINSYDLDGAGGSATNYQYQEFGGFASYTVANNSALTQTKVGALTHFQTTIGGNITVSPGTNDGDQIRVMALYEAINEFQIKTGAIATGGVAYYYIDFSKGPNWFNPTLTYQIPTVNPKVTNDTTPDLTGTFIGTAFTGGVPSTTVRAYTLAVTVNGKTYTAGEVAGERTTLGNGNIQLLDATTGLRGVFNPTTGQGTWTLTIPAADALPLATYDVIVDVGFGTSLATINKHTLDDTTDELVINGTPPDVTTPTLTSITRNNPTGQIITSAALATQNYVDYNVTFSEAVTNVGITDFQITGAGSTGSSISSVTQTGTATYTVRVSSIPTTNTGVLDLNLLETNDVIDLAGNLLGGTIDPVEGVDPTSGIDETYIISNDNASISGTTYNDVNGNGSYDAGDTALTGVTVYLDLNNNSAQDSGEPSTTSNATTGAYSFTGLAAGTYHVIEVNPSGYTSTGDTQGTNDDKIDVTLAAGASSTGNNFFDQQTNASISGTTYNDVNGNGSYDAGDTALTGVTVYLDLNNNSAQDSGEPSTTSNATTGAYSFTGLAAGTYHVIEVNPSGYTSTGDTQGTNDDKIDVTLAAGASSTGNNFFDQQTNASISGTTYNDVNGNGSYDAGDTALTGVTVYLDLNNNSAQDSGEPSTTSNATTGAYSFTGLAAGTYHVIEVNPSGYTSTGDTQGTNDDKIDVTLAAGASSTGNNFFDQQTNASISGTTYNDVNGNGSYDAGDTALTGVTVYLDLNNNSAQDSGEPSTTSNATTGAYSFTGLAAGTYHVIEVNPSGYTSTGDTQGTNDDKIDVTLAAGASSTGNNFFDQQTNASISGTTYNDVNGNGSYDAGDTALTGVTVYLDLNNNSAQDSGEPSTTSNATTGAYSFTGLAAGTYHVIEVNPSGYTSTGDTQGTNDDKIDVTLAAGASSTGNNFFDQQTNASISGTTYNDVNGNGSYDAGDTALTGVTVYLDLNNNSAQDSGEPSTTSNATTGAYSFTGLAAGTYHVIEVNPSGYTSTGDTQGTNDDKIDVTLAAGASSTGNNFFDQQTNASISGTTYNDVNGNGSYDAGDTALTGVTVYLDLNNNSAQDSGEPSTTSNATTGAYSFTGLAAGTYHVIEVNPSGYTSTGDTQGTNDDKIDVTLAAGASSTGNNFFDQQTNASISGTTYNDVNGNGSYDAGDTALTGVTVYLDLNNNSAQDSGEPSTTSNATTGAYSFTGLAAGTYHVIEVNPSGYTSTGDTQGTNDDKIDVTLAAGASSTGNNFFDTILNPEANVVKSSTTTLITKAEEVIPYTFTITNIGNMTLTGIKVLDPNCDNDPVYVSGDTNSDSKLQMTETWIYSCSHTVTQPELNIVGTLDNTVTVSSNEAEDATDDLSITISQEPMIGIAKRLVSVEKISAGVYDVTFEMLVKNYGNVLLTDINVSEDLTSTFPVPTTFVVRELSSSDFSVNWSDPAQISDFNGNGNNNLLASGVDLAVGAEGEVTLVVRVIPADAGPFDNTAIASGQPPAGDRVVDNSSDGTDPDDTNNCDTCVNKDGDPTNNTLPTPIEFGANIYDPPFGIKMFDQSGMPLLKWTMEWINNSNLVAQNASVHDPIPFGTTYYAVGASSGYDTPIDAPVGSTNIGVTCETSSVITTTTLCYYEAPTFEHPLGQIVWTGSLGPDFEVTDPALAVNKIIISFQVNVLESINSVNNEATIDSDLNGDGDTTDGGEQNVAASEAVWNRQADQVEITPETKLPDTGFAPGRVSVLPEQSKLNNYAGLNSNPWIEIPTLGLETSIIGVPLVEDKWDVTWLWNQTGWLEGSAYPSSAGNSILTSHVYLSDGTAGPFVNLSKLTWGQKIILHVSGERFIYQVESVKRVAPSDRSAFSHEDSSWLTLVTCQGYDEKGDTYQYRVLVRAKLLKVEADQTNSPRKQR